MNSGIYTITNLINKKVYVGYAKNLNDRENQHIRAIINYCHTNEHIRNAVNKYGAENFIFEIIEECEEQFLVALEHYWATILRAHDREFGYNILPTNPNGKITKHSKETIDKISKSLIGNTHLLGYKFSNQSIAKMSKSQTGRKHSQDTKDKIGKVHKGKLVSLETRNRLRKSRLGVKCKKSYFRPDRDKPIVQMDMNNNFISEYNSITLASKATGFIHSSISACCRGKRNSLYNTKWKFKND